MLKRNNLIQVSFLLLVVLFAGAIYHLFALRFSRGDIFPPYSSLRADPLGSKALFLALQQLPGMQAERYYQELSRMKDAGPATMMLLGIAPDNDSDDSRELDQLKDLAGRGNRVVLAFRPVNHVQAEEREQEKQSEPQDKKEGPKKIEEPQKKEPQKKVAPKKDSWWPEVAFSSANPETHESFKARLTAAGDGYKLPLHLPINTLLYFTSVDGWRVLYSIDGRPVLMERMVEKGSVVLVADSYLLSNEAMRKDRQPVLLSWIVGGNRKVVFDESHLGVYESRGIMTLVKKYHLYPFLAVLAFVVGLYIWRNTVSLIPAAMDSEAVLPVQEKTHFTGLVNLLRRSVPQGKLLKACFSEWKRSFGRQYKKAPQALERVEMVVERGAAEPVSGYNKIAVILAEKTRKTV